VSGVREVVRLVNISSQNCLELLLFFIEMYFKILVSSLPLLRSKLLLTPSTLLSVLLTVKVFEKSIRLLDTTQDSINKTVTPQS
jgi:hypothetical protein